MPQRLWAATMLRVGLAGLTPELAGMGTKKSLCATVCPGICPCADYLRLRQARLRAAFFFRAVLCLFWGRPWGNVGVGLASSRVRKKFSAACVSVFASERVGDPLSPAACATCG